MTARYWTKPLIRAFAQPFWRVSRGLTLGAQGIVIDRDGRVLLVRHGFRPGWHFPGGGVERGEPVEEALKRELREEAGVILTGAVELHGLFANFENFPSDHIAVFIVRKWAQPDLPRPNMEIAEQGFFALDDLPGETAKGTLRRLGEAFGGKAKSGHW